MNGYRYTIRPLGPWATPWHADTLWGSLCWAWRELAGERALEKLLDSYHAGAPPFVISDAFPGDLIPCPIGARHVRRENEKSKALFCLAKDFNSWSSGSPAELNVSSEIQRPFQTTSLLHAQRSRLTDSTEGGQLFETDQYTFHKSVFPSEQERVFSIYVRAEDTVLAPLRSCWEALSWRGFGARSSRGEGSFELVGKETRCDWLDINDSHNGFLSLSHFVPAEDDPHDGYWRIHAKNPKFAGERVPLPFKGNLITLTPGSRFRTTGKPRPFYGRMLQMKRPGLEKALHYGLALAAPLRWEQ